MDYEHGSHIPNGPRGSIPRLSRLPMPRAVASSDNLRRTIGSSAVPALQKDGLHTTSHLPRLAGAKEPLGDTFNPLIRSRYGWSDNSVKQRSISPVRNALRDAQGTLLETTPPGSRSDPRVLEEGDENSAVAQKNEGIPEYKGKRRPRPSLSERTVETLSQVSPCPLPQRRASLVGNDRKMFPPLRPVSSMKGSRPTTPAGSRAGSPTRRPFRPPGRISPTKDMVALPPVVSPDDIYTPPRAFLRGQRSRIAKPLGGPRRTVSSIAESQSQDANAAPPLRTPAQTVKVKPYYSNKTLPANNVSLRPSLSSIFRDSSPYKAPTGRLPPSTVDTRPVLVKPRSKGENTTASSTSSAARCNATKPPTSTGQDQRVPIAQDSGTTRSPKSSAALREAVAKAKANRKKALAEFDSATGESTWTSAFVSDVEPVIESDNKGLLRKRIQDAPITGQLNIAGLGLKHIPAEVLQMYDSDNSTISWSEMVDLVKLNAADNELQELGDQFFPDYTTSELPNDDEKSNMFGGLEMIDLHRSDLHRLPVGMRRLGRLQTLNLTSNKLRNDAIDIAGQIPQLKELMVGKNLIAGSLSFSTGHFEHLQHLDLHGNGLQRLHEDALSQLKHLKVLNVADNKLTTLPWEILSNLPLTEVDISKNLLVDVLFAGTPSMPNLRRLDASYNQLERLSEAELDLPALRSLILDDNRITELPDLTNCRELELLGAAENQLNDIPPSFVRLKALKSAHFANNNIRLVNPEIATMENLSSLTLVGNPLRQKKYLSMATADLKRDLEKKLETNRTETESRDAMGTAECDPNPSYRYKPSGGILDLSSRALTAISAEEIDVSDPDTPVHTLKLSNNELCEFPAKLLSHPALKYSVQSLDLSHNPLLSPTNYLDSELFLPNLKSLYIVSTGLTSLDALTTYLKAPSLTEINISCHRLTGRVPWVRAWWPNCQTLLATDNWFTSVEVEGVRGLEVLDVRNNEIESLPPKIGLLGSLPGAARASGTLRVLEVSGNKFRVPRLTVVEKGTEAILKDLRRMVPEQEVPEEWKHAI